MQAKSAETGADPVELPPPTAELVLIRVFVEAYLATCHEKPRRRARAFMDVSARILANEESVALISPIRPARDHAAVSQSRHEALALFGLLRPTFLARLPPEDI